MLKNVGAERGVYFLPAAQVSCSFVEQVAVSRRQQVPHEYHRRADRHQDEELAGPALVHVLRALKTNTQTLAKYDKPVRQRVFGRGAYLDEPHGYEGHIVGAEHGANQHLLHSPVEVHLQILHLLPDEVRREAAGVGGHGLHAVQLAGVLLPRLLQHRQVVPATAHAANVLGADAGEWGERPGSPEIAAQPKKRDIHSKPAENDGACDFDGHQEEVTMTMSKDSNSLFGDL